MTPCTLVHDYRSSEELIVCIFVFEGLNVRQDNFMNLRSCGMKRILGTLRQ